MFGLRQADPVRGVIEQIPGWDYKPPSPRSTSRSRLELYVVNSDRSRAWLRPLALPIYSIC